MKYRRPKYKNRAVWLIWYALGKPPWPHPDTWGEYRYQRLDVLNADLAEAYILASRSSYVPKMIGAQYCPALSDDLRTMWRDGLLSRVPVGIDGLSGMGFPKWVWQYSLTPKGLTTYHNHRREGVFMTHRAKLTDEAQASLEEQSQRGLFPAPEPTRCARCGARDAITASKQDMCSWVPPNGDPKCLNRIGDGNAAPVRTPRAVLIDQTAVAKYFESAGEPLEVDRVAFWKPDLTDWIHADLAFTASAAAMPGVFQCVDQNKPIDESTATWRRYFGARAWSAAFDKFEDAAAATTSAVGGPVAFRGLKTFQGN